MMSVELISEQQRPTLETVVRRIDGISTLPHVALRVMEVANDLDSNAVDLKQVVETDAALSARILRCVNSSAYAIRREITSLQQAIAYLGLRQVRNLAMTATVSALFHKDDRIGPYCRSQLWQHSVSVGICARMIAMRQKMNNFEEAFLAGLLHDIGIVLEDQHAHMAFVAVIQSLDQTRTLAEVERSHLGFDHTTLGEKVASIWRFPEAAKASIRHHHASVGYRGAHSDIVRCVEVANLICTLKGIPSVGLKLVKISQPALAGLSLTREDITVLAADLDQEIAAGASLFQI
ncbi:MAG: HDOD domain-containing protein [Pirellulaceae bacterium]